MSTSPGYRELIKGIECSAAYKADVAALRFVAEVVRCMRARGMNQAELARRIGASQPYASKVLRGDANFTLTTMVKLADALGQELHLHFAEPGRTVRWHEVIPGGHQRAWPMARELRSVSASLWATEHTMIQPPLLLERSFVTEVKVDANPDHEPGTTAVTVTAHPAVAVLADDATRWQVELDIAVDAQPGTPPPRTRFASTPSGSSASRAATVPRSRRPTCWR